MGAGRKNKLYRNTGTNATPTWVEVTEARDVDIERSVDQVEEMDRSTPYKKVDDGHIDLGITFGMTYRNGNANCDALIAALHAGTVAEYAAMDGDITVNGTTGLRMFGKVFQANTSQGLGSSDQLDIVIRPTYHEESAAVVHPSEYTVSV